MTKRIFYKNKAVIIVILVILIIAGSVAFGNRAFSYNDTITHPSLTDNIAKVYNTNFDQKLNSQEVNWLIRGSIEEDLPIRWMNHFYDPNTGAGLWNFYSSKNWAQNSVAQSAYFLVDGDQTWQKAMSAYAKNNTQEAFIALGHILHLLEDATVPAHTRLDAHPEGDPYENWVMDKVGWSINFSVAPVAVGTLNAAFDDLANYSSRNFLSKDTIQIIDLSNRNTLLKEYNGKTYRCIQGTERICLILVKKELTGDVYYLDDLVHSDYFSLLAPKAISYGAGVIKLFFDEAEKTKQEYEQKSWWQKLRESVNELFSGLSGSSLYAGIRAGEVAPSGSEAPESEPVSVPTPIFAPMPPNAVEAREKIVANLPAGTIMAEEKLGGNIAEEITPQDAKIPSAIIEETVPTQAKLPSPTPLTFLPGAGGAPTPTPSPSPGPDTTAPETTITPVPAASIATTSISFIFTSSESGSTFGCQLDGAATSSCVSPKEYTDLSEGSHIFKVSATDAAGNQDSTPAEHSWTIDLTAPQITNIASTPGRTSALISWTASEAGIFQIEYGTSTSYSLTSATTSAVSLSINLLTASTIYHFRILAQDSVGNATSTTDNVFTTTSQAENIVISEIVAKRASGDRAKDEFIEIYNPTSQTINIKSWSVQYASALATTTWTNKYFNVNGQATSSLPDFNLLAGQYFLLASATTTDGYSGSAVPDLMTVTLAGEPAFLGLADSGGKIRLLNFSGEIADIVGWGDATIGTEGDPIILTGSWVWGSLERKATATSTAALLVNGVHQWQGNSYDSNNNSQDFVLQDNPNPQNSLMLTEPRITVPNLMTASAWPTWQGNLARTGQTAAASLATSTLAVKWTATTTVAQSFISHPVLDSAGNIYIGRTDGLAKYSSSGNLVWLYSPSTIDVEKAVYTSPLIADDGTIYFRGAWGLYAVNQEGKFKWKYSLSGSGGINATPAFLSDGAIITQSDEKVYAINQDATLKWIFNSVHTLQKGVNFISAFVVDSSDNIYVAIEDNIYKISSTGGQIWNKNLGSGYTSLALEADNILYISAGSGTGSFYGGFYALNTNDGSVKWSDAATDTNNFNNRAELAPIVDSAGGVYTIMFYGGGAFVTAIKLQFYNATSSVVNTPSWTAEISANLASPVLTRDGRIYIVDQSRLKIFDAQSGELLGFLDAPGGGNFYQYFGAIGADGTIYTASSNSSGGTLYAIESGG